MFESILDRARIVFTAFTLALSVGHEALIVSHRFFYDGAQGIYVDRNNTTEARIGSSS